MKDLKDEDQYASLLESPTMDKIFFDISFDFPDPKDNLPPSDSKTLKAEIKNTCEIIPKNITEKVHTACNIKVNQEYNLTKDFLCDKNSQAQKFEDCQLKDSSRTKSGINTFINKSTRTVDPIGSFVAPSKNIPSCSNEITNVSKPSNKSTKQSATESVDYEALFDPNKSIKKWNDLCESSSKDLHPEDTFKFKQPSSKKPTITSKKTCNSKRHKSSKRNEFLLTQAAVSGSDCSDQDGMDDDEEGFEQSFIDDNTLIDNTTNQYCMYLQSIKNISGPPQKFKLRSKERDDNELISQLPDEGCSKYLLDSFCVDDNEVLFDDSSDEEVKTKATKKTLKLTSAKRKRVVTLSDSSSSDEELFLKKVKPPNEQFLRKITPDLSSPINKASTKGFKKPKPIISSDEESTVRNINASLIEHGSSNQAEKSKTSGHTMPFSSNIVSDIFPKKADSGTKLTEQVDAYDEKETFLNFSFDIGWNDDIPDHVLDSINNLVQVSNDSEGKTNVSCSKAVLPHTSDFHISEIRKNEHAKTLTSNTLQSVTNFSPTSYLSEKSTRNVSADSMSTSHSTRSTTSSKMILVDSRELASGKPVISLLRNKYGVNPVIMQLTAADYVISNKVAVERFMDSDFPNTGVPPKILEKVRVMSDLYEKPFVIIETDSRKKCLGFNKLGTKYLQFAISANLHPRIKVLFSNCVDDTSLLIFDLIEKEVKNGLHIDVPIVSNPSSQKLFEFYCSLPNVSQVCALNFVYHFPSPSLLFDCSVEQLKTAGLVSNRKAKAIYDYLRSELLFNPYS